MIPSENKLLPAARLLLLLLALTGAAAVRADEDDPSARAARLADVEGAVSLQPAGVGDWTAAMLNRPLTVGDRLWSDSGARAEVDAGDLVARLGESTAFAWLNLSDTVAQMQLSCGTLIVRVRDIQPGQIYEIDTPNLALSLQQPGAYRVDVSAAGDVTVVKVEGGSALAAGGGQTISIAAQQQVTFTGTNTLSYEVSALAAPDALDGWSAARDEQQEDSASNEYVASDTPGTQDLDNNGTWQATPDYGYVWVPSAVVSGWAPYRVGHWVWVSPWGWSWVDAAPWGYAPFHYGRWAQCTPASWCWVPGPRSVRPVYAPALVAWVGAPSGDASGFAGRVGWFPLGPREVYVPAYRASSGYVRRVNVANTIIVNHTSITNIYENNLPAGHYANNRAAAVTAVPQSVFVSGGRIGGNALRLSGPELAGAVVSPNAPAITPITPSTLTPSEGRPVPRPPPAIARRPVVAHAPPPAGPIGFAALAAAVAANGGHVPPPADYERLRSSAAPAPVRKLAIVGPVLAAGSNTPRPGMVRPAAPDSQAPVSFAARERILEHPMSLPPPLHATTAQPNAFVPPAFQPEPSVRLPNYAPPSHTRAGVAGSAAPAPTAAPAAPLPVFHPPVHTESAPGTRSAAPVTRLPSAAPAAHPQPATKPERANSSHSERDLRTPPH